MKGGGENKEKGKRGKRRGGLSWSAHPSLWMRMRRGARVCRRGLLRGPPKKAVDDSVRLLVLLDADNDGEDSYGDKRKRERQETMSELGKREEKKKRHVSRAVKKGELLRLHQACLQKRKEAGEAETEKKRAHAKKRKQRREAHGYPAV